MNHHIESPEENNISQASELDKKDLPTLREEESAVKYFNAVFDSEDLDTEEEKSYTRSIEEIDFEKLSEDEKIEFFELIDSTPETENDELSINCAEDEPVSKDELAYLDDNDFGAVNDKVINYDLPDYQRDGRYGINSVNWGKDSVGKISEETLPQFTKIVRYSYPNPEDRSRPLLKGKYFSPENTDYKDLELPQVESKRIKTVYEVKAPEGLNVLKSEIAIQPWNLSDGEEQTGTNKFQYKTEYDIDVLLTKGIIDEINDDENLKKKPE